MPLLRFEYFLPIMESQQSGEITDNFVIIIISYILEKGPMRFFLDDASDC
jgi:hypothetical protein